jgi:hypothetical protein
MAAIIPAMAPLASPRHAALALAISLLLLCFTPGCTSGRRVTIPDWQQSVGEYVKHEGDGRASVLRDVTIRGGRRGFAVLGNAIPARAQDVVGVLLAHRTIAGRPTFVYLVAQVVRQQVKDVRLALLSDQEGQLNWLISPESDGVLRTYLQWRKGRWQGPYPGRDKPPLTYQGFPLDEDAFDLAVGNDEVAAEHPASGARWAVRVPTTQPATVTGVAN